MNKSLTKNPNKWRYRRHMSQALVVLLFVILPLPLPGFEHGLLKVDFNEWRVHFFGITLVPGLLHLFSLGIMLLPFLVAVIATLWSKAFCGWICPQNIIYELFEGVHSRLRKRFPSYRKSKRIQNATDLAMSLTVAALATVVANSYFVGASPIFVGAMSLFLMTFITMDSHVWKHDFCRNACPYAFLQQSFHDNNSLHIAYEPHDKAKCGACTACEKACYVDLDIKKDTFHIDCTLCGACVDASNRRYSRQPEPPLLRFAFEKEKEQRFQFLGINTWLKAFVVSAFLLFCSFYAWSVIQRPTVKFRIDYPVGGSRSTQLPIMQDGKHTNNFVVHLQSLQSAPAIYRITVDDRFVMLGDEGQEHRLSAFEKVSFPIQVQWKEEPERVPALTPFSFTLYDEKGEASEELELYFRPAQ